MELVNGQQQEQGIFYNTGNFILNGNIQLQPKLLLSGTEFYNGSYTWTDGIAIILGV